MAKVIKRAFTEIAEGQVFYRYGGADKPGTPLIMLHVLPGTSLGLVPVMELIAKERPVYAIDMLGCGESAAPRAGEPDIAYFGESILRIADSLGFKTFDLYGNRVGAHAALETALAAPERVRRLVVDGLFLFPWPTDVLPWKQSYEQPSIERMKDMYAPKLTFDHEGSQFHHAWTAMRDTSLFWPWYERDAAHARTVGLPSADELHDKVVEFLRGARTNNIVNRASFSQDWRARCKLVKVPTLAEANAHPFLPGAKKKESGRFDAYASTPEKTQANARDILAFLA
jgi:pimeloyl-ACP methyl ester carboxylesterase